MTTLRSLLRREKEVELLGLRAEAAPLQIQALLFIITAIIISCFQTGCHSYFCSNEFPAEHPSPDGKWKYVVFDRNCGATTSTNFQVSVLPSSASLPNAPANAFTGDYNHGATSYVAKVEWINSGTLLISYSPKARIFRKETHVGPIE